MSIKYITDFHEQVKSKPKQYSQKIHIACKMIDKLLKRKDIEFKESDVIAFESFCGHLKHLKGGAFAGKSIKLEPHQKWAIACVLGIKQYSKKYERWLRYFKEMRYFVARKEGKSLLMSLLGIWGLCFDFEQGAEVYCQASKKEQARLVFDNITKFIKKYPQLSQNLKVVQYEDKKVIRFDKTDSVLTYMSAGKRGRDGQSPSMVLNDEIHEWGVEPYQAMTSGLGARLQPLIISMSTAGLTKNSLYQFMYSQIEDMCDKEEFDDNLRIFFAVFEIDADDNPNDKKCWCKANPALISGRLSLEYLEQEYSKAIIGEVDMTTFMSKHLNRSCSDARTYYTTEILKSGKIDITSEHYYDTYAYGGVDLAEKTDFCVATVLIPYQHSENPELFDFVVLQRYFKAANRIEKDSANDKMMYSKFICTESNDDMCSQLLYLSSGDAVNFKDVVQWFVELRDNYKILFRKIGYDPADAGQFVHMMKEVDFTIEDTPKFDSNKKLIGRDDGQLTIIRQGPPLSEPIKMLKILFEKNRIKYDKTNALLPYCLTNAKVSIDKNNKYEIAKKQSNGRIDGAMALLDAIQAFSCDREKFIAEVLPYSDCNKLVDKTK